MKNELIFEKEIELLQPVRYSTKSGSFADTSRVILKAPTFAHSDKLETALRQLNANTAIANFICDNELIVSKDDGRIIPSSSLNELHIKTTRHLVNQYCKFFLASESPETETKFVS